MAANSGWDHLADLNLNLFFNLNWHADSVRLSHSFRNAVVDGDVVVFLTSLRHTNRVVDGTNFLHRNLFANSDFLAASFVTAKLNLVSVVLLTADALANLHSTGTCFWTAESHLVGVRLLTADSFADSHGTGPWLLATEGHVVGVRLVTANTLAASVRNLLTNNVWTPLFAATNTARVARIGDLLTNPVTGVTADGTVVSFLNSVPNNFGALALFGVRNADIVGLLNLLLNIVPNSARTLAIFRVRNHNGVVLVHVFVDGVPNVTGPLAIFGVWHCNLVSHSFWLMHSFAHGVVLITATLLMLVVSDGT